MAAPNRPAPPPPSRPGEIIISSLVNFSANKMINILYSRELMHNKINTLQFLLICIYIP